MLFWTSFQRSLNVSQSYIETSLASERYEFEKIDKFQFY